MIYLRHRIISYSHSLFCCRSVFAYIAPTSEFKTQNWTIWSTPMRWATNSSHFRYSLAIFVRSLGRGGNIVFSNICSNAKHYCQQFQKKTSTGKIISKVKHWMDPKLIPYGWGLFRDDDEVLVIERGIKNDNKLQRQNVTNNHIEWYHKRMANYTKWYQLVCHVLVLLSPQNRQNLRYWASLQAALSVLVLD